MNLKKIVELNRKILPLYTILPVPLVYAIYSVFRNLDSSAVFIIILPAAIAAQTAAIFTYFPGKLRFVRDAEVSLFKAVPPLRKFGEALGTFFKENESQEPELKEFTILIGGSILLVSPVLLLTLALVGL